VIEKFRFRGGLVLTGKAADLKCEKRGLRKSLKIAQLPLLLSINKFSQDGQKWTK
jgi:hypothetical protein